MPPTLQSLITAIPTAEDGHVITEDYHNSLRAALVLIASQLGDQTPSPVTTLTFAPRFSPNGAATAWLQSTGFAAKPAGATAADGWLALQLPNGVHMQSMTVIGDKSGDVGAFTVQLSRQSLTSTALVPLSTISLFEAPDSFQVPVQIPASAGAVDNSTSKYLVTAKIIGAQTGASARIFGIQVVYGQS